MCDLLNNDPIPTHGPAQRRRLDQRQASVRENYRAYDAKRNPPQGDVDGRAGR
jgi:hypothetical protein